MAREVRNLLARIHIVQGYYPRVTACGQQFRCRRERDAADGVHKAGERVRKATRVVVEDVDGSVFVA